jgi:hypothetical protein
MTNVVDFEIKKRACVFVAIYTASPKAPMMTNQPRPPSKEGQRLSLIDFNFGIGVEGTAETNCV